MGLNKFILLTKWLAFVLQCSKKIIQPPPKKNKKTTPPKKTKNKQKLHDSSKGPKEFNYSCFGI